MGEKQRVQKLREEVGILTYMKHSGLVNESNKGKDDLMLKEFAAQTSNHSDLESQEQLSKPVDSPPSEQPAPVITVLTPELKGQKTKSQASLQSPDKQVTSPGLSHF